MPLGSPIASPVGLSTPPGALQILFESLQESLAEPFSSGQVATSLGGQLGGGSSVPFVKCWLGEQHLRQNHALPRVVMVPRGGPYTQSKQRGYAKALPSGGLSSQVAMPVGGISAGTFQDLIPLRCVVENVELHLYALSNNPQPTDADHFSAVEWLRMQVVQALESQKRQGLYYVLENETWVYSEAQNKYGRQLVIRTSVEITIPSAPDSIATIKTINVAAGNQ